VPDVAYVAVFAAKSCIAAWRICRGRILWERTLTPVRSSKVGVTAMRLSK
jgi:hypothetical protein